MRVLESYFTGLGTDDIRLAGHRIGIDDVIRLHQHGLRAQAIQDQFDTLSLEEIYACLLYYYAHQTEMEAYLQRLVTWRTQRIHEAEEHPSSLKQRLVIARQSRQSER